MFNPIRDNYKLQLGMLRKIDRILNLYGTLKIGICTSTLYIVNAISINDFNLNFVKAIYIKQVITESCS